MYRYLALIWEPANGATNAAVAGIIDRILGLQGSWAEVVRGRGMAIYGLAGEAEDLQPYILENDAGVIVGRLFRRGPCDPCAARIASIDADTSREIVRTRGHHLITNFWGCYVAFIADDASACRYVLRDCSGRLPCYFANTCGAQLFFSDGMDVAQLGILDGSINLPYIAAFLQFDDLRIRDTALLKVTEVLAGECVTVRAAGMVQTASWDPLLIARSDLVDEPKMAVELIRNTTQHCIRAWAAVHRRILHQLSGGFDSAVVLGCLSKLGELTEVVCLNRFSITPGEDEREHARTAARRAGVRLIEVPWDDGGIALDERLLSAPLVPKPSFESLTLADTTLRSAIARELGAHAIWTGQGGDHLFFRRPTALTAADYFHDHGLGPLLPWALADAARLSGESFWSVLRKAIASSATRQRWGSHGAPEVRSAFVNPDALPADFARYVCHPWLTSKSFIPGGKQLQIRDLADLLNQPSSCARLEYAPEHHPLVSQPLIELCLQIPTYLLVRGGRHRALARSAFASEVPEAILERESKGSTKSYTAKAIRNGRGFLRQLLLDGFLVQEGLVKRRALEAHLTQGAPLHGNQFYPLMACIAAEVWAQSLFRNTLRVPA